MLRFWLHVPPGEQSCTKLYKADHMHATSAPQGFVIMNLEPLSPEQQTAAIGKQLSDNNFFSHLQQFSEIRKRFDEIYVRDVCPVEEDRQRIEKYNVPNLFKLANNQRDAEMRQKVRAIQCQMHACLHRGWRLCALT